MQDRIVKFGARRMRFDFTSVLYARIEFPSSRRRLGPIRRIAFRFPNYGASSALISLKP